MKRYSILLAIVILATLAGAFSITPVMAQAYGPLTPNLLIHVYTDPDTEFEALGAGEIDITDWPMSKTWVDQFNQPGSGVELRSYAEIGHMEFDINNQKWPTGVETPRTYDPATGTYKHYYDDGGTPDEMDTPDERATEFRKAIAYLTNKEEIVSDILKGYAARQDTDIPYPALAGYIPPDLEARGLIYNYDPVEAAARFDAGGFTQGTTSNPHYDPDTPGSAQYIRTDPLAGGADLSTLKMWVRLDDPNRKEAGLRLAAQLRKAGIPMDAKVSERTVCYNNVMVIYDFHLYTGGWSLSADAPDSLHFLFHSEGYWGGTETSSFGGMGWSANYDGFCDDDYDYWAEGGKYGSDLGDGLEPYLVSEVKDSGFEAQYRMQKLVGAIPLWASLAVEGFRTGWTGVVNYEGQGPKNGWSFLNMEKAGDDTIDWGFKSNLETLNMITSEWVWDHFILDIIYESLIAFNPYNLAEETGMLAESWTGLQYDSGSGLYYADFTLRDGVTFHNGDALRPKDVKFSLEFLKAVGPGVGWTYSDCRNFDHVDTATEDPTLGANVVRVYFVSGVQSYWAVHWAGFQAIFNERIWMAANSLYGWGYVYGETDWNEFPGRELVRDYSPELSDVDEDGDVDLKEDGAGAWIFESMNGATVSASTAFALVANTAGTYFLSQSYVHDYIEWAFWTRGDTTKNRVIDISDGQKIAIAIVGAYDADANIAPDPSWDNILGVGHGATEEEIDVLDLNVWALSTKTNFPRDA